MFWIFAGIFFHGTKIYDVKKKDFSEHPIAEGTVLGTYDFNRQRWMVKFTGPDGKEVIGADHIPSENTFHPENYTLPKRGYSEKFYYWEHGRKNNRLRINHIPVLYYIHFCNEDFYTLPMERNRRNRKYCLIASAVLFLLGIVVLIWGH